MQGIRKVKKILISVFLVALTASFVLSLSGCSKQTERNDFFSNDLLEKYELVGLPIPGLESSRTNKNVYLSVCDEGSFEFWTEQYLNYLIQNENITYFGWPDIVSTGFIGIGMEYEATGSENLDDYRENIVRNYESIGYGYTFYFTTLELNENNTFANGFYITLTYYDETRIYVDIDKNYKYNFFISIGKISSLCRVVYIDDAQ